MQINAEVLAGVGGDVGTGPHARVQVCTPLDPTPFEISRSMLASAPAHVDDIEADSSARVRHGNLQQ